jgi:hypothetical protein
MISINNINVQLVERYDLKVYLLFLERKEKETMHN